MEEISKEAFIPKKLRVLNLCSDNSNNGVFHFRNHNPLQELAKQDKIILKEHGYDGGQKHIPLPTDVEMSALCADIDIIYTQRNDHPDFVSFLYGSASHFGIPVLLDIDDNVHAVRPMNPGYKSFHPGSQAKYWNLKLAEGATALTVSTKNLFDLYSKYKKPERIFTCPNSLDFDNRDKFIGTTPEVAKNANELRIGWAGSSAHYENLAFIEPVIYKILDKYPQTTFFFTGLFGDLFDKKEYKERIKIVEFADIDKWPEKLAKMGLDIAIAPLCDNMFNRAKSNLRCIEYQACKYAVVASDVEPYRYIVDGQTGFIANERDDWYTKISKLVENDQLRWDMGDAGYNQAKKEYDICKNCDIWLEALNKTVDIYKRSL